MPFTSAILRLAAGFVLLVPWGGFFTVPMALVPGWACEKVRRQRDRTRAPSARRHP